MALFLCKKCLGALRYLHTLIIEDHYIRPRGYKKTPCSTQLLIKTKIPTIEEVSAVVFIMLINVKMPTIVGILAFMSRINFVRS